MTITFTSVGAIADGTSPVSVAYPTSIVAGNLLLLFTASKPGTATPTGLTGWGLEQTYTGGIGSDGSSDAGSMVISIYSRVAVGDETGSVTFSTVGTPSVTQAVILQYAGEPGATWDIASAVGKQDTPVRLWRDANAVVMGSDPGFAANDVVLSFHGINGNQSSSSIITADPLSAPGVTTWAALIERTEASSSTGRDQTINISEHRVVAGTSTGAATYSADCHTAVSYSATPTGPVILLRIREAAAPVAPVVTAQPSPQSVIEGNTANFTASFSGATSYQWKRKAGGAGTAADVVGGSGATTQSYVTGTTTLTGGSHNNGDTYALAATNAQGTTTTDFVPLTVTAGGGDATAPTTPGQPTSSAIIKTGYTMTWTAATDNVGVTGYEYQINAETIVDTASASLSRVVTGRTPGATDSFRVRAYDAAGNRSSWSTARTVTMPVYGFDFHTLPKLRFVAFVGSLTDLSLLVGRGITVRANDESTGAVVATSSTMTTNANGRLARWTSGELNLGTTYEVVFKDAVNGNRDVRLVVAT